VNWWTRLGIDRGCSAIRVRRQFLEHDSCDALKAREARLALGLLLLSGARGQDMVTFRRQHCRGPSADVLGGCDQQIQNRTMHDHE
jgi:hypothetical protein